MGIGRPADKRDTPTRFPVITFGAAAESGMQKRYDDGFRGPAVADALQLNDCWADLHARDLPWPMDEERIEQIKGRTSIPWPAAQLDAAIRHTQREDAIARCIISAAESGVLPMWIAPIGEPDRPVAPSALLELGIDSLKAGCYRPYNDRDSDLFGRPLFVKRDHWRAFVAAVTARLTGKSEEAPGELGIQPYTDDERQQWMRDHPGLNADDAHREYRADPRYDGTKQAAWRAEWKRVKGTRRGAQPKQRRKS